GDDGKTYNSTDNGTNWNYANWNYVYTGVDKDFNGVAFGNNLFVEVGNSGKIFTSSDNGSSWDNSNVSTTGGYRLNSISFGNNTFVAVANGGFIFTSTNGTSWIERTSGTSNDINGITYGNGTFVAVGKSGTILTSDNGTSWDKITSGSTAINGITYGNGTFVAVGNSGTILTSDNGTTWASTTSGTTTINGITYGNSTFVAVAASGKILTSTNNGASWEIQTSTTTTTSSPLNDVIYANNTFVTVGNNVIINSPDEGDITDNLNSSAYTIFGGSIMSGETVDKAFDGSISTKSYNSGGAGTGVIINAGTTYTVSTLGLTTANDMDGRDPASFSLYGSNDHTCVGGNVIGLWSGDQRTSTDSTKYLGNVTAYTDNSSSVKTPSQNYNYYSAGVHLTHGPTPTATTGNVFFYNQYDNTTHLYLFYMFGVVGNQGGAEDIKIDIFTDNNSSTDAVVV
ncbi:uncharacterized protein METZ01_LOCUS246546, partial [marine metagenome]